MFVNNAEQALLQRARSGDRKAFDRLQKALEMPLRRFVRRLIGPSEEVDDIVREVLLSLYSNLGRLNPPENLRPFLFRVARNLAYSELRRQGRFETSAWATQQDETGALARLPDSGAPPDETVLRLLLHAEVQQARDRLPEPQRQALILYCDEDFSYEQIAEALGIDIGTVKSRLHYARLGLKKQLKPETLEALGIPPKKV